MTARIGTNEDREELTKNLLRTAESEDTDMFACDLLFECFVEVKKIKALERLLSLAQWKLKIRRFRIYGA